jgi:hypothetical protein
MIKQAVLLLLFSVFLQMMCYSQQDFCKGTVITLNNDTLYGLIDYRGDVFNSKKCRYKPDKASAIKEFSPGEIKAYRITGGKYYISKEVEIPESDDKDAYSTNVFLEYLFKGKVDVYYLCIDTRRIYYIDNNGQLVALHDTERMIQRDGATYATKNETYKGILLYSFNDVPELKDKIERMDLSQKSLVKVTSEYHNKICPGESCILYIKKSFNYVFAPGVMFLSDFNRIELESYFSSEYDVVYSSSFGGGINCDIWNTGSMERFFFNFQVARMNNKHTAIFEATDLSGTSKLSFETSNFGISCLFAYKYPKYRVKPYAGMGISYYQTYKGSGSFDIYDNEYNTRKKALMPMFALGAIYDLNDHVYFKAETSFQPSMFNHSYDYMLAGFTSNVYASLSIHYALKRKT